MTIDGVAHEIDERWTMAYAAALGDFSPTYLDTTRPGGVVAHPVFAVCPEWPVIVASRDRSVELGITPAQVLSSVHATHDVVIHRLLRPGDRVVTSLEIVGLVDKSPGAMSTTRLRTVDAAGSPVATTTQNGIYLGFETDGVDVPDPEPPPPLDVDRVGEPSETAVPVDAGAAHTYTECARIWNPIHTDKAVALASGLPDIILHGTANLAHGISQVVAQRCGDDPALVRRISCRFAAMVLLPSTLTVRVWPAIAYSSALQAVPFEVLNERGESAVKDGVCLIGEPPALG